MIQQPVFTESERQANAMPWKDVVAKYQVPTIWRSTWQIVNSMVPYAVLWYLMYRSLAISYWLTVPLVILAAGFLVRIFIIFHDCGHGSFFKSRKANDVWGMITGVLDAHAVLFVAVGTRGASCQLGGSGSARQGRCLDVDSTGVPGIIAVEAVRLSAGP